MTPKILKESLRTEAQTPESVYLRKLIHKLRAGLKKSAPYEWLEELQPARKKTKPAKGD